jgi:hypothetical protein
VVPELPSLHVVPSALGVVALHEPVAGSQVPAVWQPVPSWFKQVTCAPPTHVPVPLHVSFCVQKSPSLHDVPEPRFA